MWQKCQIWLLDGRCWKYAEASAVTRFMPQVPGTNGAANDNLLKPSLQSDPALESVFVGSGSNLGQMLADIPVVIYECDSDLEITRISSNTRSLLGMDPQEMFG